MKKITIFILILGLVVSFSGCGQGTDTKVEITEMNDYAKLEEISDKFKITNDWDIFVLGEDVSDEIPMILVEAYDEEWKCVPLLKTLKIMGATITWENENEAIIKHNKKILLLNLEENSIKELFDDIKPENMIAGGRVFYQFVDGEVIVSGPYFLAVCHLLDLQFCYRINNDKTIIIDYLEN